MSHRKNICAHCEYKNRFIDLGLCPECKNGRIVGDLHTKAIFCSALHYITTIGIPFAGNRNCYSENAFGEYEFIIISEIHYEDLLFVSKHLGSTPVQIYKAIKEERPLGGKVYFYKALKIGKYLSEKNISFKTVPDILLMCNFAECFPDNADDYEWVLKKYDVQ